MCLESGELMSFSYNYFKGLYRLHILQRIQVECLTATVVAFVVTVELICVARQNDRRC